MKTSILYTLLDALCAVLLGCAIAAAAWWAVLNDPAFDPDKQPHRPAPENLGVTQLD